MKNKMILAAALAPMVLLSACDDTDNLEAIDEQPTGYTTDPTPVSIYLTDESGNRVESLEGQFGTYYLHIEGAEAWSVKSHDAYIVPAQKYGTGSAVVTIYAGECWNAKGRNTELEVSTLDLDAATRSAEEQEGVVATSSMAIAQAAAYTADEVDRYGASMGVGYAYNPATSEDVAMATGLQIFDVKGLQNDGLLSDDASYSNTEDYLQTSSQDSLNTLLSARGGLSLNISNFAVSGSGAYASSSVTDESNWIARISKRTVVLTREFNYTSDVFGDAPHFTTGYKYLQGCLESSLSGTQDTAAIRKLLQDFIAQVGPYFIYKAQLGAELDYTGTIAKSILSDGTYIQAALQLKWSSEVVSSTASSSSSSTTAQAPAVRKFIADAMASDGGTSVEVDGDVEYNNVLTNISNNTTAHLEARGGTSDISILGSGGTFSSEQLAAWTLGINSSNAVLVAFRASPIYETFKHESLSYAYLKHYLEDGIISK